jgi:hypothetical protein
MQFTKRLRERVRKGEITCTVRIWKRLQVRGYHARTGAGVGVCRSAGSAQGGQARQWGSDLPDPVPLCAVVKEEGSVAHTLKNSIVHLNRSWSMGEFQPSAGQIV